MSEIMNVLVTLPLSESQKARLITAGGETASFVWTDGKAPDDTALAACHILIGTVPPARLAAAKSLRWLNLSSAGADAHSAPGVLAENVQITNSAGAYGVAVSEHMVALTFGLIRRFREYIGNSVRHEWKTMGQITSVEESTILVIGPGDIGGRYAAKMKALGAYTIGVRRHAGDKPEWLDEQVTADRLNEVLPKADVVAMAVPGGRDRVHMIGAEEIALMKDGAFIINVGRGNAIDADALKTALTNGKLGGAGLDVTDPEPLTAEDSLWDMENVIITPHAAGNFFLPSTLERVVEIAADNLSRFVSGQPLTHVVSRTEGY